MSLLPVLYATEQRFCRFYPEWFFVLRHGSPFAVPQQNPLFLTQSRVPFHSLSAGQMSIRIIFHDSVFKNLIIFIFYKYVLFMDKIAVFLTLELSELIFHVNCWKSPHLETFKLRK